MNDVHPVVNADPQNQRNSHDVYHIQLLSDQIHDSHHPDHPRCQGNHGHEGMAGMTEIYPQQDEDHAHSQDSGVTAVPADDFDECPEYGRESRS